MRELLTKDQLQTIFNYLKDYSNSQAWKDVEAYCYSLKTIRMNGAFREKNKEGVTIVLKAIEANIGDLNEFCKKHEMIMFSFDNDFARTISQEIQPPVIPQKKEPELHTIYYATYEGIHKSVGVFTEKEILPTVDVKKDTYTLYVNYTGDISNIIKVYACNINESEDELDIVVDSSGKYVIETNNIIKKVLRIVCENSESILCEIYAIYEVDDKE